MSDQNACVQGLSGYSGVATVPEVFIGSPFDTTCLSSIPCSDEWIWENSIRSPWNNERQMLSLHVAVTQCSSIVQIRKKMEISRTISQKKGYVYIDQRCFKHLKLSDPLWAFLPSFFIQFCDPELNCCFRDLWWKSDLNAISNLKGLKDTGNCRAILRQ